LDEPVDVVVTTAAGYPLDLTFYQTVKAMTAAIPAVKPGGVILVASRCDEGVGSPPYTKLMRETSSVGEFRARMWDDERFTIDQWQLEEQCRALDHAEVWLYTEGLSHLQAGDLLVRPVESVKRGVTDALALFGPRACLAVIPDGPYVMPTLSR
jgi:nickel-dependent lactate racemase